MASGRRASLRALQSERQPHHRLSDLIVRVTSDPVLKVLLGFSQAALQDQSLGRGVLLPSDVCDDPVGLLAATRRPSARSSPVDLGIPRYCPELDVERVIASSARLRGGTHRIPVVGMYGVEKRARR